MRFKFLKEVAAAGLPSQAAPDAAVPVTDADIATLPVPAQRYLRFMGVVNRPRDWSVWARWTGGFRLKPTQTFMDCEAWSYDTRLEVARIFLMRLHFLGLVPMLVRDTYLRGCGRMQGRLFDLAQVVDGSGAELDIGELTTYLNDALLLAPGMVLGPETKWTAVDDDSFDISLTDHGRTVTARVRVDAYGALQDFSSTDRFCQSPDEPNGTMIRARWTTPVSGWQVVNGRPLPTSARAEWHLADGPFCYADFRLDFQNVIWNVFPGE